MMMGSSHWKWRNFVLEALVLAVALPVLALDQEVEITGFRVPEYDEQSEMTSQLFGDRALMQADGKVRITQMKMDFYRSGKTFMTVTSPYCIYDQKTNQAFSDAPIAADMEGVRIRGVGFELDSTTRLVKILDQSKVVIANMMQASEKPGADAPAELSQATVITSKILFLDYNGREARFEESVHVEDPEMKMDCAIMTVGFNEKNEIDWIEALTDVKLYSKGREATAGKALYNLKNAEFLLEDNPQIKEGLNVMTGDRIRFDRDSGRMLCEPSARLIMYPDKDGDKPNINILGD